MIDILNIFLRQRWVILGIAAAFGAATAAYLLIAPKTFSVEASFIVQQRDQTPAVGLAAQLGMDLNNADATQSPEFYAALLRTPDVLDKLLDTTFRASADRKPRNLAQIWGITRPNQQLEREAVMRRLQEVVSSNVSGKLGLVQLKVVTQDPQLAKQLADAILQQVNWFNLRTRQSRAAAERQFDERLVAEVGSDLRRAEDQAQQFLQQNQQPRMSAALEMEKQRLVRRLEILNARYVSLVTAYDRARIDEVRDTPVITVIQRPRVPIRADSRGILKLTILMVLLGLGVGAMVAIVRQAFQSTRLSDTTDVREFHQLLDQTSREVRKLWTGARRQSTTKTGHLQS